DGAVFGELRHGRACEHSSRSAHAFVSADGIRSRPMILGRNRAGWKTHNGLRGQAPATPRRPRTARRRFASATTSWLAWSTSIRCSVVIVDRMGVVDLDRRAAVRLAALIDAVSNEQLDAPPPCPAWTVRHLLTHLVAGNLTYT